MSHESPVAFRTALCLIHAELDQRDEALAVLHELATDDFAVIPYDVLWLQAMCNCREISVWLGDRATAAVLLDRLRPFHDQFALFVTSLGSVAHFAGAVAGTLGRFDEADELFAEAVRAEVKAGAITCLARTRLDWAAMLVVRDAPEDHDRARPLLANVISAAETIGLPVVERRARELMATRF